MTDPLFAQIFRALDLAVVERLPNAQFHLLTPAPSWLERAFELAPPGSQGSLDGAFPFLDDVLHESLAAWRDDPRRAHVYGPFAATIGHDELLLRATALTVEQRTLLVIERLTGLADPRATLQKARERMLEGEQLVRQVQALHAPADALTRAVEALQATDLPVSAQSSLTALTEAAARLRTALAPLPTPPQRTRR